eukprot:5027524-Lingulodinium_polyedra.AAC.1
MKRANVRFAGRCAKGTSIQPRQRATFAQRCKMMRSNRCVAAATARKLHTRALHAHAKFGTR